jgi:hypothetical protein
MLVLIHNTLAHYVASENTCVNYLALGMPGWNL